MCMVAPRGSTMPAMSLLTPVSRASSMLVGMVATEEQVPRETTAGRAMCLNKMCIRDRHKTVELPAEEDVGGAEEYRNAIWPLYTNSTGQKLWNGLFVAPSSSAIAVHYGDIQMRDGQRSGQSTGLTYSAPDNETITAPQSGTVVLADTLTLTGGTVVIDHGCGVKSYLFGLKTVTAQRGQTIEAGSPVGTRCV